MDEIIATFKLCSHRTSVFHELLLKWNDVGYFPPSDRKNKVTWTQYFHSK